MLDSSGNQIRHLASICVDGALIVAVGIVAMKLALAAAIEATFVLLGDPDLKHRRCPLAMDNWLKLAVAEHQLA